MKRIFLLGSTGSIGKNTLDVVEQHPDEFMVSAIVTNRQIGLFAEQVEKFKPQFAIVFSEIAYKDLSRNFNISGTKLLCGEAGIKQALENGDFDIFVNAFVGFAGLNPTVLAIRKGLHIALANKETLVVAGKIIMDMIKKNNVKLLPVDSEHSAIWQSITGEMENPIKRIILTASGGPFRNKSVEQLSKVTPQEALRHPNWSMGAKITIDSATLMNKGLEVIEAFWLYEVLPSQIDVLIHPQSIIHSMVEFEDNSIKAQLGIPDMRIPIQYALSYPKRLSLNVARMDFNKYNLLTFENPDTSRFPCLTLAYSVLEAGKSYPVILNASNEVAVEAFLNKNIKFTDIPDIIKQAIDTHNPIDPSSVEDLIDIDYQSRVAVKNMIKSKQKI
jgi:1-deoxy-D-xylulose-5-phosphate reductoisomerase